MQRVPENSSCFVAETGNPSSIKEGPQSFKCHIESEIQSLDMWLSIKSPHLAVPLYAVVSSDGELYFRASDVAKLMSYRNTSQFAKTYSRLQVKDVLYKKLKLPPATLKTWILPFDDVVYIFQKSRHYAPDPEDFTSIFESDNAFVHPLTELTLSTSSRKAVKIEIVSDRRSTIPVKTFFKDFISWTLQLYENLALEYEELTENLPKQPTHKYSESDEFSESEPFSELDELPEYNEEIVEKVFKKSSFHMHLHLSQLDHYKLSAVPKTVKIFFGSTQTATYNLA